MVSTGVLAQVGIGTTTPNVSSALDIESTTQGLLPPRMSKNLRDAINNPAEGLVVYCTDCSSKCLHVYDGTDWKDLCGGTSNASVTTTIISLTSNNDDVEEVVVDYGDPVGTMDLTSSDLELGGVSRNQGLMNIGLRYNNVNIPQGSTVTEAYIQFNAADSGNDSPEISIYGENVANAVAYTGTLGNLSSRVLTNSNVVWNIPEWVNEGDRGDAQKTVNIATIINEIVNRSDWVSNNSINIIMKPTGTTLGVSSTSAGREAETYSSSNSNDGAELIVMYQ